MRNFKVFTRNWWRVNDKWPNGLEPTSRARRTHLAFAQSEEEARDICRVWNLNNPPGKLSRRAEYSS
jgi:hypothetical protein